MGSSPRGERWACEWAPHPEVRDGRVSGLLTPWLLTVGSLSAHPEVREWACEWAPHSVAVDCGKLLHISMLCFPFASDANDGPSRRFVARSEAKLQAPLSGAGTACVMDIVSSWSFSTEEP